MIIIFNWEMRSGDLEAIDRLTERIRTHLA